MDTTPLKIGCLVMAAGNGSRFGGNKLTAEFQGRSLIRRALDAVPSSLLAQTVVVTQYPDVAELAKAYGFTVIINSSPQLGQSHTIRLGLDALQECDAVLFQVADQPLLQRGSVAQLIDFYRCQPAYIAGLGHNGQRGNPCIFPARFYPELRAVEGDRGGNVVIRAHEKELRLWEVPAAQLQDVDTAQALSQLRDADTQDTLCPPDETGGGSQKG